MCLYLHMDTPVLKQEAHPLVCPYCLNTQMWATNYLLGTP